jgi:hypothetical protein
MDRLRERLLAGVNAGIAFDWRFEQLVERIAGDFAAKTATAS